MSEIERFTLISDIPEGFEEVEYLGDYRELYKCPETDVFFIIYLYGRWNSPKYMVKLNHYFEKDRVNFKNEYVDYLKKTYPTNDMECRTKYCKNKVVLWNKDVSIKKNQYCVDCWIYRKGVYD